MTERGTRPPVDYARLGAYLRSLGVPNRLELLRKLQIPHTVAEIDLAPSRASRDRAADRPISRQAIEAHLRKLQDLGLVHARTGDREGRGVTEYVVNHARLFVVVEELRRLSAIRSLGARATELEGDSSGLDWPEPPEGPALVLVGGPLEGTAFPLAGGGPWGLGREKGLAVSLPYDPFVSKEHARITRSGGAFAATALASGRNGTRVNWRPVPPGESVVLRSGDSVGVGRSLLVLRGA